LSNIFHPLVKYSTVIISYAVSKIQLIQYSVILLSNVRAILWLIFCHPTLANILLSSCQCSLLLLLFISYNPTWSKNVRQSLLHDPSWLKTIKIYNSKDDQNIKKSKSDIRIRSEWSCVEILYENVFCKDNAFLDFWH
jgi:hypothetical protein